MNDHEPRISASPLDLRLSTARETPLYHQLTDQLRLLVSSGALPVGSRLPAARQLAESLGINRNTALKAYLQLAREGIVEGRRGGGTVIVSREPQGRSQSERIPPEVMRAVDQLLVASREWQIADSVLVDYVQKRIGPTGRELLRVAFVECNPDSLSYFVSRLQTDFGVTVVPVLLRDLSSAASTPDFLALDAVVSTFFHLSEVRRLLIGMDVSLELFAIGVRPHLSVLEMLETLPRRAKVGVIYYEAENDDFAAERLKRMADAVRHSGIRPKTVLPVLLNSPELREDLAELDAVVVRPENIAPVRSAIPSDVRVIEFVNDLDDASRQFMREVFSDLAGRRMNAGAEKAS